MTEPTQHAEYVAPQLILGDCVEVMATMTSVSFDAVVTDPPYGLSFMGKDWDRLDDQRWHESWAIQAFRILKPGGHLLAFGGTRTYHRLVCAIEDAGFEIRDSLHWFYGSGFPKSTNPAKQDKSVSEGLGTALKPAHEPIVLARKPLVGTVVTNILTHGTGALNVAACRTDVGRWPANVVLDEAAALELDEQSGILHSQDPRTRAHPGSGKFENQGAGSDWRTQRGAEGWYADQGGASRFFYVAKPSRTEKDSGLNGGRNTHPTVKPVALMRWLVRLVTPPGGMVLDPFVGSGTTGVAALTEGYRFVGIDENAEYLAIAQSRLDAVTPESILPVEAAS